MKYILLLLLVGLTAVSYAQEGADSVQTYKKRVLENTEVDLLISYYSQDGEHAAVTGGIGTEELTDVTPTIQVAIPLNDDDVLTIDAGISAYTSASSSNIDPFDGNGTADAYQASSGASQSDTWLNGDFSYSHSSDDRNTLWSGKLSISNEFDYSSFGFGGSFTRLFNEKNTEVTVNANIYLDTWETIYPYELRPFEPGGRGLNDILFNSISGNIDYSPDFTPFTDKKRNSYSAGLNFSQIMTQRMQGSLSLDLISQQGLLSTPFQRVYFSDVEDSYIGDFHLADDIERLPDTRLKMAAGGRLNYYVNEMIVLRSYYRYYWDDWGITSNTISLEVPVKLTDKFTVYPSYRYYNQTKADYFAPYEEHLSTDEFYTSDYDLSAFDAGQVGFGVTYTDIFTSLHLGPFGLKSIDLKYHHYKRNTGFTADIIAGGFKFIMD